MEILRLMATLLLIILVIAIGSKAIYRDNFAIISGNSAISASQGKNEFINYPEGFTADNCVLISCGIKYNNQGYNYVGKFDDSMDLYWNAVKRTVTLTPSNILLRIENPMTEGEKTFSYKIVLMKIS